MGGKGSGRWRAAKGNYTPPWTVEDVPSLRIEELVRRAGMPDPGLRCGRVRRERMRRAASRVWSRLEGELSSSRLGPLTFAIDRQENSPRLVVRFSEQLRRAGVRLPDDITLELATTRPQHGGERWWFQCPSCHRRCGVLYLSTQLEQSRIPSRWGAPSWFTPRWACRTCHRLVYPSQRETRGGRALRRLRKVLGRGRAECGKTWLLHRRPRYMHRRSFERLRAEALCWFSVAAESSRRSRRVLHQLSPTDVGAAHGVLQQTVSRRRRAKRRRRGCRIAPHLTRRGRSA